MQSRPISTSQPLFRACRWAKSAIQPPAARRAQKGPTPQVCSTFRVFYVVPYIFGLRSRRVAPHVLHVPATHMREVKKMWNTWNRHESKGLDRGTRRRTRHGTYAEQGPETHADTGLKRHSRRVPSLSRYRSHPSARRQRPTRFLSVWVQCSGRFPMAWISTS